MELICPHMVGNSQNDLMEMGSGEGGVEKYATPLHCNVSEIVAFH